jgi:putative ABC transport system substrate-binding protein
LKRALVLVSLVAACASAGAQPAPATARVAVLMGGVSDPAWVESLERDLAALGWHGGRNLSIVFRWSDGDRAKMRAYASELASTKPDVLVVRSATALREARAVAPKLPTVFVSVSDPLQNGFVTNLSRPGGTLTGFANLDYAIAGKWLELIREVAPRTRRVLVVQSAANPNWPGWIAAVERASLALGVKIVRGGITDTRELDALVASFAREPDGALLVLPDPILSTMSDVLLGLAALHRLPAVYGGVGYENGSGLLYYGVDPADLSRNTARYVDRILRGEKPGDLPVQSPTRFQLVINARVARELGMSLPPALLARADRVVDPPGASR